MLSALLIGNFTLIVNMAIQVSAIVIVIGYLLRRMNTGGMALGFGSDIAVMGVVLFVLFLGHQLQFATWAILFMWLGEFADFDTAYYHSVVNFTSLGYGDIVMSEKWRLLGALEAANGILMFGLTASSFMAVMNRMFARYKVVIEARRKKSLHETS